MRQCSKFGPNLGMLHTRTMGDRSPDGILRELLEVLQRLQNQQRLDLGDGQPVNQPTVLERMGGVPKHLLKVGNLSD